MHHGREGWELVEYTWCEDTGIATLTYERPGGGQVIVVRRPQPAREHHTHWYMKPIAPVEGSPLRRAPTNGSDSTGAGTS